MFSKVVKLTNKTGLHARPASDFVGCSSKFASKIILKRVGEEEEANAKSIVMILSLAIAPGDEIEITAKGDDEIDAVEALVALVEDNFGES